MAAASKFTKASPALREMADRLERLSYQDMMQLAEMMDPSQGPAEVMGTVQQLLFAAKKIHEVASAEDAAFAQASKPQAFNDSNVRRAR